MRTQRVLFLAANPEGTDKLAIDREVRGLEERLRGGRFASWLSFRYAWAVRVQDLAREVREHRPHIVHFSGHGSGSGIVVEDEQGAATLVSGEALDGLFRLEGKSVRAVVLNACLTAGQADAIARSVPFVVGTDSQIQDASAIEFAGRFYEELAAGGSCRQAYEAGVNGIDLAGGDARGGHTAIGLDRRSARRRFIPGLPRGVQAATAGGVAIAALGGLVWPGLGGDDGLAFQNTEIVLDASGAMHESIPTGDGDETNKRVATTQHLAEYVAPRSGDRMALRIAQECDVADNLAVDFRTNAATDIIRAWDEADIRGTFGLAEAVVAASSDFNDVEQFPPDRVRRQIVVVTAGGEGCHDDPVAELRERWAEIGSGIRLAVDFVGLGLTSEAEQAELEELAAAVDGRTWLVDDASQLGEVVRYLFSDEPVVEAADSVVEIGNGVVEATNQVGRAVNDCDAGAADDALSAAEEVLSTARPALSLLSDSTNRPEFVRASDIATEWVESMGVSLDRRQDARRLLEDEMSAEECDELRRSEPWSEAIDRWNEAVDEDNRLVGELQEQVDLLFEAFPPPPTGS